MKTFTKTAAAIFILLVLSGAPAIAQVASAAVPAPQAATFAQRTALFHQTEIYLHIDKSVYTANENIWLKSYMLKSYSGISLYHTLFVFLSSRATGKVVSSDKYIMENGMSAGALLIPDSVKAGEYNLIAYTNTFPLEKYPFLFQQQVSVRKADEDKYAVTFEQAGNTGDSLSFICKIRDRQKLYPKNANVFYKIFSGDSIIAAGRRVVNDYGEIRPSFSPSAANALLDFEALIVNGRDSFYTGRKPLIPFDDIIKFRWFPESGGLTEGISTKIAFEATAFSGKPATFSGMLYEDDKPAAKLRANEAGLGTVTITANASKKYSIKPDNELLKAANDFPEVKKYGYNLALDEGVVNDSIAVNIQSSQPGSKVHLMIHDYESILGYYDFTIAAGRLLVKIPIAGVSPGLLTLTLLDSLEKPCAERTILAGLQQAPHLTVQTDSASYHKRSKVKLKIIAKDKDGNPLAGEFSLAFVYRKRIDTLAYQSIFPYSIFNSYTQYGLMDKVCMYNMGTKEGLEMLLLTRCWTKYKEPATNAAAEKIAASANTDETGYVLKNGSYIELGAKISIIGNGGINEFYTNQNGGFTIPPEMLAAQPDERLILVAGAGVKSEYEIKFHHQNDTLQKRLAVLSFPEPARTKATLHEEEKKVMPKEKTLEAAVVKSKADKDDEWGGVFNSTTCKDWVCLNNILNCANHPTGTKPVEAATYMYKGQKVVYKGCSTEYDAFTRIKGRYYSKEFYKANYARFNAPDPELQSTVYWQPYVTADASGEASLEIYTNDLPGNFIIMLQGVTEKGAVSAAALIRTIE